MKEPLAVRAETRAAWRRWLTKHHESVTSVLLVYARKQSGRASVTYEESVEEALCFGWIDGVRGKIDDTFFTVRFTPRKPNSFWSKVNMERVAHLAAAGKMHAAGVAAFEAGKRAGRHTTAYRVSDKVEMPGELGAELRHSTRGRDAFEALPPGQQNAWMRWVAWAKHDDTRSRRARDALRLMLAGRKPGETDAQAARRGVPSKARILGR